MADLVPFGKYRGQPVERLSADPEYCKWLTAQEWFRTKFPQLLASLVSAEMMDDTPEHNAMQAKWLDDKYCLAFLKTIADENLIFEITFRVFEYESADVMLSFYHKFEQTKWDGDTGHNGISKTFWIELKSAIGDDYPSILRKVINVKNKSCSFCSERAKRLGRVLMPGQHSLLCQEPRPEKYVVVTENYTGLSVKWGDVVKIFASSGVSLILESDILF